MTDLSPSSQAVLDASNLLPGKDSYLILAAALRATVDQAHPKAHIEDIDYVHQSYVHGWKDALDVILAIAAELEGIDV